MSRWWRAYDEALHDPKLLVLPDKLHRVWFNLLCIASKHGGILPAMNVVAIELRVALAKAGEWVAALVAAGLFDEVETGKFVPHNWSRRQFQSDVSTERVKRFRERERNVSSDVSETPPETDSETEQIQKEKDSRAVAAATRPKPDDDFENFWKAYPKRDGANPKTPARKLFLAAVKAGTDPASIVEGAAACAVRDREKVGTPYIPQAVKWLRDRRWEDYSPRGADATGPPGGWKPGLPTNDELRAKYEKEQADGEGKADRVEQASPVDEGGERLCGAEPRVFRGQAGERGIQKLGDVFPANRLGPSQFPGAEPSRGGRGDASLDRPMPMARVADDHH